MQFRLTFEYYDNICNYYNKIMAFKKQLSKLYV